jgi:hypothetical protein
MSRGDVTEIPQCWRKSHQQPNSRTAEAIQLSWMQLVNIWTIFIKLFYAPIISQYYSMKHLILFSLNDAMSTCCDERPTHYFYALYLCFWREENDASEIGYTKSFLRNNILTQLHSYATTFIKSLGFSHERVSAFIKLIWDIHGTQKKLIIYKHLLYESSNRRSDSYQSEDFEFQLLDHILKVIKSLCDF